MTPDCQGWSDITLSIFIEVCLESLPFLRDLSETTKWSIIAYRCKERSGIDGLFTVYTCGQLARCLYNCIDSEAWEDNEFYETFYQDVLPLFDYILKPVILPNLSRIELPDESVVVFRPEDLNEALFERIRLVLNSASNRDVVFSNFDDIINGFDLSFYPSVHGKSKHFLIYLKLSIIYYSYQAKEEKRVDTFLKNCGSFIKVFDHVSPLHIKIYLFLSPPSEERERVFQEFFDTTFLKCKKFLNRLRPLKIRLPILKNYIDESDFEELSSNPEYPMEDNRSSQHKPNNDSDSGVDGSSSCSRVTKTNEQEEIDQNREISVIKVTPAAENWSRNELDSASSDTDVSKLPPEDRRLFRQKNARAHYPFRTFRDKDDDSEVSSVSTETIKISQRHQFISEPHPGKSFFDDDVDDSSDEKVFYKTIARRRRKRRVIHDIVTESTNTEDSEVEPPERISVESRKQLKPQADLDKPLKKRPLRNDSPPLLPPSEMPENKFPAAPAMRKPEMPKRPRGRPRKIPKIILEPEPREPIRFTDIRVNSPEFQPVVVLKRLTEEEILKATTYTLSTLRSQPSTSRSRPSTSRSQPFTSRSQPSTSRSQPSTSRSQPSTSNRWQVAKAARSMNPYPIPLSSIEYSSEKVSTQVNDLAVSRGLMTSYNLKPEWWDCVVEGFISSQVNKMQALERMHQEHLQIENKKIQLLQQLLERTSGDD